MLKSPAFMYPNSSLFIASCRKFGPNVKSAARFPFLRQRITLANDVRHARRQRNLFEPCKAKAPLPGCRASSSGSPPATCAAPIATPPTPSPRAKKCRWRKSWRKYANWPRHFKDSSPVTRHSSLPLVELTGGEPLLQKNSLPLMKSLCDDGFTVLLETSGAHDISPVDPRVHRIMDLKCPSSGEVERNRWENLKHLKATDEIKFVIGTRRGLRLGETANCRTQARFDLSAAVFLGASARAGTANQVVEKSSGRADADFAARAGGKNHCRRAAGAVSGPAAQNHLAAGTARSLAIYDLRFTIYDGIGNVRARVNRKSTIVNSWLKPNRFCDCFAILSRAMFSFIEPDGSWPIVWERARDVHVWDADGKKYLDLTAAFGVAAAGHANPARRQGRAEATGPAASCDGRRASARAQGRTRARIEPDHLRALDQPWTNQKLKIQNSKLEKSFSPTPALKPSNPRSKPRCWPPANTGSSPFPARITDSATARSTSRTAIFSAARSIPSSANSAISCRSRPTTEPNFAAVEWAIRRLFPPRMDWRDSGRAGAGARRHQCSAAGISADAPQALRRTRRAVDSRRNLHRLRPHRKMVRLRAQRRRARSDLPRQGADRRLSAVRLCRARRSHGCRLAGVARRGDSHQHVPRQSGRLRDGAGANRGNRAAAIFANGAPNSENFC